MNERRLLVNIDEEKTYIYSLMRSISEERRKLTDIYYDLKKRLDTLHDLEQRGLENLSLKGYIDLSNEFNKSQSQTAITNIKREVEYVINNIENDNLVEEQENVSKTVISNIEIQKEKDKDSRGKGYMNIDKVITIITSILKEAGQPLSLKEIHEKTCEQLNREVKFSNLRNNIMPRAVKKSVNITKAQRGYYQYKFS